MLNREQLIHEMENTKSGEILVPTELLGRKVFVSTSKKDLIQTIRAEFAENQKTGLRLRNDEKNTGYIVLENAHRGRPNIKGLIAKKEGPKVPKKRGRPRKNPIDTTKEVA